MKYVQPLNATDPNGPYVLGNPLTGVPASTTPAEVFEHPQREIVNAIIAAGLTPATGDLTQLAAAIALIAGRAVIASDLTITVGSVNYPTIKSAMAYLNKYVILPGVAVTISVPAGDWSITEAIGGHPQGSQITIKGAAATFPANASFAVTGNNSTARTNDAASNLALLRAAIPTRILAYGVNAVAPAQGLAICLENLLFQGNGTAVGISANSSSFVSLKNVAVHAFNDNYNCLTGGNIVGYGGVSSTAAARSGFAIGRNASVYIDSTATAFACVGSAQNGLNIDRSGSFTALVAGISSGNGISGAYVTYSGHAYLTSGSIVAKNGAEGLFTYFGSISARGCTIQNNDVNGVRASGGGMIDVALSTVINNTGWGIAADTGGNVFANSVASASGNSLFAYYAAQNGRIFATGAANTALSSPAINTAGNVNGYIAV